MFENYRNINERDKNAETDTEKTEEERDKCRALTRRYTVFIISCLIFILNTVNKLVTIYILGIIMNILIETDKDRYRTETVPV